MILDTLAAADLYAPLHPAYAACFAFLRDPATAALPDGTYNLDGDNCFAIITRKENSRKPAPQLESHRVYIDIHYVFSGQEEVGWIPTPSCAQRQTEYDTENDYELWADAPESSFVLHPGQLTILYPADAHSPMSSDAPLHKVVFKVKIQA